MSAVQCPPLSGYVHGGLLDWLPVWLPETSWDRQARRPEVCGIAPLPGGFLVSDGLGGLVRLGEAAEPLAATDRAWDNHIVAL